MVELRLSGDAARVETSKEAAPRGSRDAAAPEPPRARREGRAPRTGLRAGQGAEHAAAPAAAPRNRAAAKPTPASEAALPKLPLAAGAARFPLEDAPVTRIHAQRLFYPGQTYKAEELVEETEAGVFVHRPTHKSRHQAKRGKAANAALLAGASMTNIRLLTGFTSETGRLLPRRTNKIDAKVQRALVRAIKTARMMAILPYTRDIPPPRFRN
jgi:small subunit ribosomal protein S18